MYMAFFLGKHRVLQWCLKNWSKWFRDLYAMSFFQWNVSESNYSFWINFHKWLKIDSWILLCFHLFEISSPSTNLRSIKKSIYLCWASSSSLHLCEMLLEKEGGFMLWEQLSTRLLSNTPNTLLTPELLSPIDRPLSDAYSMNCRQNENIVYKYAIELLLAETWPDRCRSEFLANEQQNHYVIGYLW